MFKKFLWFFVTVAFMCSPLWAESGKLSSFSKEGNNTLQSLSCGPKAFEFPAPKTAGPQDFCPYTNPCLRTDSLTWCVGVLSPNWILCSFQDPTKTCPPNPSCPTYPFEVKKITILLCNTDPVNSCIAVLQGGILNATYPTNPSCPEPGNLLCQGPQVQVQIPPNTSCFQVDLPLVQCCVSGPYFACVTITTPGCGTLYVCADASCMLCWNYIDFGDGIFRDGCLQGSPGDFAIWTEGLYCCQSLICGPCPAPDTLKNHYKTWRVSTPPVNILAKVRDQFATYDTLKADTIDFLSNPVLKIVQGDTSEILRPDDHLTWYKVKGKKAISVKVNYSNQFESTSVYIDSVKYLLLPTQKDPHPAPDSLLGHYTAYKIRNPITISKPVQLQDQFDLSPEFITSLVPLYFLTPAIKNNEPAYGPDTHYVAYLINSPPPPPQTRQTLDQFGVHFMQIVRSELLLVPTRKIGFTICTHKPNDCTGDGMINLADITCDVNIVFKGFPKPIPNCRCDSNCDNVCNLADIIYKVNYVFKGGPKPIPCGQCCIAP